MQEVGSYEAKTHLPALLRAVERGETVVITRRGTPIARIVPMEQPDGSGVRSIVSRMKEARRGRSAIGRAEILSARDEGRRS